jgi:acylphosphatase
MAEAELARLHAVIEGHVQGVGFRFFVQDAAVRLRLTGWVRNLWDGNVEVMAEGDRPALEQLIAELRRGPRGARVTGVKFEWEPYAGEYPSFYIKSTN